VKQGRRAPRARKKTVKPPASSIEADLLGAPTTSPPPTTPPAAAEPAVTPDPTTAHKP